MKINYNIPLSEFFEKNLWRGLFVRNQLQEIGVDPGKFQIARADVENRLNVKLVNGRCSNVLLNQLARHALGMMEKFGDEYHTYHMQSILEIIECIEKSHPINYRGTFKGPQLKGLNHAHHGAENFISTNTLKHWVRKYTASRKSEIEYQNELLLEVYNRLLIVMPEENARDKALPVLLNEIHSEAQAKPYRNRTGEWLVYAEINKAKYYLCLGTHNEGDGAVRERLEPCFNEFPILKNIIQ